MTNRLEYPGYNDLMSEIRRDDWDDPFGAVQYWRFAIAEVLYFDHGDYEHDFHPSPLASGPEDSYAVETVRDSTADEGDLQNVLAVLDRLRVWIGLAGQDY